MTSDRSSGRKSDASPIDFVFVTLATFLGTGLSPVAPGTVGSLAACGAYFAVVELSVDPLVFLAAGIVVSSAVCVALGPWYPKWFGKSDPSAVVVDECAGQWIALVPVALGEGDLIAIGIAFLAFRLFDVTKILGVKRAERMPGGWGVLMDDVVAGGYAALIVWAVSFALPAAA